MTADAGPPATSDPSRSPAVEPPLRPPITTDGAAVSAGPGAVNGSSDADRDPDQGREVGPDIGGAPPTAVRPGEPVPLLGPPLTLPAPKRPKRKSAMRLIGEWVLVLGTALAAALLVQAFFLKAFFIPSGSMKPTLDIDDRVLVNKLSYRFGDVQPGDVIVFKKPDNAPASEVDDFIKRAIAVSGDVIEARDGVVFRNGEQLDETYLAPGTTTANLPRQTVPDGMVFVMGDNRNFSVDSRIFGPIDEHAIVGEALVRVWPLSHLGTL